MAAGSPGPAGIILGIICCSPAAPSPAALEVKCSQMSQKTVHRATDSFEQAI